MPHYFKKVISLVKSNKIKSIIALILVAVGFYYGFKFFNKTETDTRYILSAVSKGTLSTSVSASGQISATEQIDIKSKASGDVVYVGVSEGQNVKAGQLILQIDSTDAQQAVNNAQTSLDKAELSFQKMKGLTTDEGTLRGDKQKAQDALDKSYEDGFNDVSNIFLTMPSIISGLHDILFKYSVLSNQQNSDWYTNLISSIDASDTPRVYRDQVIAAYNSASIAYDKNFDGFRALSRISSQSDIYNLISETYDTSQKLSDAVKTTNNFIDYIKKTLNDNNVAVPSIVSTHQSSLSSYTGTTNGYLSTLLSDKNTIDDNREALINTGFDLQDQQNQVDQAQQSLNDAKEALADYYVRVPFDGLVATLNYKRGDSVSNGSTIGTAITNSKVAEVTLSEVDIVNVKVGDKAILTLDSNENLEVTGEVISVDFIGSVSSGVVSYGVKISLDTDDDSIKPGMSTSATIITDTQTDTIIVPTSAVKFSGDTYYVQVLSETYDLTDRANLISGVTSKTEPENKVVEIGISDDSNTEIVSGLSQGDQVVVRTSSSATSSTTTSGSIRNTGNVINIGGSGGGAPPGSFAR
jgi:RND family efflux transporter MFP subunit